VRSISAGKALPFSEQEFILNQRVGRGDSYNSRHFLPYLLAPKTRGPRSGTDPGITFYIHISDRYAPFHTKVINATVRDATHVLDGLLYHESDLRIEEHYTDTLGFTDHVFFLCHALGSGSRRGSAIWRIGACTSRARPATIPTWPCSSASRCVCRTSAPTGTQCSGS